MAAAGGEDTQLTSFLTAFRLIAFSLVRPTCFCIGVILRLCFLPKYLLLRLFVGLEHWRPSHCYGAGIFHCLMFMERRGDLFSPAKLIPQNGT